MEATLILTDEEREIVTLLLKGGFSESDPCVESHGDFVRILLGFRFIEYYRGAHWKCGQYTLTNIGKNFFKNIDQSEFIYNSDDLPESVG